MWKVLLRNVDFLLLSKEQIETVSVGVLSPNTERNNKWALSAFEAWRIERNIHFRPEEVSRISSG